jgi:hypothetical protein
VFISYQNYLSTALGGQYTTYAGSSGSGPCGNTDDIPVGSNAVTSEYTSANSPVTVNSSTTASSLSDGEPVYYDTSTNTFYPNETLVRDIFYATWSQRITKLKGYYYSNETNFDGTPAFDEPAIYNSAVTASSECISYGGDSGVINAPDETVGIGFAPFITTAQSNYYKTTQQTNYFTTVPVFSEGECSTATVTLAGNGTKLNATDNFTTQRGDIFSLISVAPNEYGTVNYYHVGGDEVLFTGVPGSSGGENYRFSDVYQSIPATSYSYKLVSSNVFAYPVSSEFYEFIPSFNVLALRPIILGTWTDSDISTSGSYWAGFGNSFTAADGPAYKTLTTSSSGDTWDESNLLQTSDIGNPIEDAGPRIIQTGCQPWMQDGTTAWSVPASTVQSSIASTLEATYSSTVSTSTAEGQPTTSTRSDKYATYTLGLDSIAANSDTTAVSTLFPDETKKTTARGEYFTANLGRDNAYTSKQTLMFNTGVFITSTENNGGADIVGTMTLNQTNGTFESSVDIAGVTFTETFSGWTRELDQGAVIDIHAEKVFRYVENASDAGAFAINTNLSP